MTDNGSAYVSGAHRIACAQLGIRHLRTRPYRPRTNGKAERFIQTMLRRWAYRAPLPLKRRTHRRAQTLAQPLQLHPSARQHRQAPARLATDKTT